MKHFLLGLAIIVTTAPAMQATYYGSALNTLDNLQNACCAGPLLEELIKAGDSPERFSHNFNEWFDTREKKIKYYYRSTKKKLELLALDQLDQIEKELLQATKKGTLMVKGIAKITATALGVWGTKKLINWMQRKHVENRFLVKLGIGSFAACVGSYFLPKQAHWAFLDGASEAAARPITSTLTIHKQDADTYNVYNHGNDTANAIFVALFFGKMLRCGLDASYQGVLDLHNGIHYISYLETKKRNILAILQILKVGCHEEQLADIG